MSGLNTKDLDDLRRRGAAIRHLITSAPLPLTLEHAIIFAYEKLSAIVRHPADVAIRSSATAEDLPDASFAGQQETYVNVQGTAALLHAVRQCFASLFTDRAISWSGWTSTTQVNEPRASSPSCLRPGAASTSSTAGR